MAKKKSNPQSENNKPPKTQDQSHNQTMDDAASEKLDSLKSLNAMLLKETVERRQQVDSLIQLNGSLKSELNRYKSDKVSLQLELNGFNERAVMSEIENGLVSAFVSVQVNQMAEVSHMEKDGFCIERVAYEEKIGGLERYANRILEEKSAIEKVKNKKESEIRFLNDRLDSLVSEIGNEKAILSQVCEERDEIWAQLNARIQDESELRLKLVESEKKEAVILEKFWKLKTDYDGLVEEKTLIERRVNFILKEKVSFEQSLVESNGLVDELKRDIKEIVKEKMVIEEDRNVQQRKKDELQNSFDGLNDFVHKIQKNEEQLLVKVADLEGNVLRLTKEKSLVMKDLEDSQKMLEQQKLTIDRMAEDKTEAENAKNRGESNIANMKEQLHEFKNTIVSLEKSSTVQINKVKQLEADVSHYRVAFDQATSERNESHKNLDQEKLNGKNLSEKISKLEKGMEEKSNQLKKMKLDNEKLVAEKNKLDNTRAAMAKDILLAEKTLAKTRKECDDVKGKLGPAEANSKQILKILKNTTLICQSKEDHNMGFDQENGFELIKPHVTELEAIKKAFRDKEGIVQELKRQLELLKVSVAKAHKGKSFWALVSSATTVLAAVSLAYVARGH